MKNIGLFPVDSKNYPNLALMKLSAWHKQNGDNVEITSGEGSFDLVYASKIFTYTPDRTFTGTGELVKGGTGYDLDVVLPDEIEHICPDYALFNTEHAYGFLTRGCIRKCGWCVVPKKEGAIKQGSPLKEFIGDKKSAVCMDNNVLAHPFGVTEIEEAIRLKIKLDFNQGLDARLIAANPDLATLLAKVKWIRFIRMACDTETQLSFIQKAVSLFKERGVKPYRIFVYALIQDVEESYKRIMALKRLGVDIFAQPYRDFTTNIVAERAKDLARWVNRKAIFKTVPWEEYDRTKGHGKKEVR